MAHSRKRAQKWKQTCAAVAAPCPDIFFLFRKPHTRGGLSGRLGAGSQPGYKWSTASGKTHFFCKANFSLRQHISPRPSLFHIFSSLQRFNHIKQIIQPIISLLLMLQNFQKMLLLQQQPSPLPQIVVPTPCYLQWCVKGALRLRPVRVETETAQ